MAVRRHTQELRSREVTEETHILVGWRTVVFIVLCSLPHRTVLLKHRCSLFFLNSFAGGGFQSLVEQLPARAL